MSKEPRHVRISADEDAAEAFRAMWIAAMDDRKRVEAENADLTRRLAEATAKLTETQERHAIVEREACAHASMVGQLKSQLEKALAAIASPAPDWRPIDTAPRDGTKVDLWIGRSRVPDAWWGRPEHSCGEYGQLCDSCPPYNGWCDTFGYLTGDQGREDDEPTHWRPKPTPPAAPTQGGA